MKRTLLFMVFIAIAFTLIVSCGNEKSQAAAPSSEAGSMRIADAVSPNESYIFVNCLGNIEYFNAHKYSWAKAGEQFGVKTSYLGPADFDIPAMIDAFNTAIAMNPAGIAVWGVDASLIPVINRATDLGIPVVTVVGDLPDSSRIGYVGSYQYDLGYAGGKGFAESIDGSGKVAILTLPGVSMFDDREQGFRDAFAEYPGIDVVAVGDTKADSIVAVSAAKDIMVRFPDLAGFVGTDSTAAMGAAIAVEESNKVGEIGIVGMDRNTDVLEKIRSGVITASVAQGDVMIPFWALQILINHNHYDPKLTTDNAAAGVKYDPSVIYIPANYIDADNLEFFVEANQEYLNY